MGTIKIINKFGAIGFLLLIGCVDYPNDIVLEDNQKLVLDTLHSVKILEEKTGLPNLITTIKSSNNPRYFRGNTPHRKVIAIELVDQLDGEGSARQSITKGKCLIQIEKDMLRPTLVAHEILHCKGVKHSSGLMSVAAPYGDDYQLSTETLETLGIE